MERARSGSATERIKLSSIALAREKTSSAHKSGAIQSGAMRASSTFIPTKTPSSPPLFDQVKQSTSCGRVLRASVRCSAHSRDFRPAQPRPAAAAEAMAAQAARRFEASLVSPHDAPALWAGRTAAYIRHQRSKPAGRAWRTERREREKREGGEGASVLRFARGYNKVEAERHERKRDVRERISQSAAQLWRGIQKTARIGKLVEKLKRQRKA